MNKEEQLILNDLNLENLIPTLKQPDNEILERSHFEGKLSYLKSKYMSSLTDALNMKKNHRDRIFEILTYDSVIIPYIKKITENNTFKIIVEQHIQLEFFDYTISQNLINIIKEIPNNNEDELITFYIKNIKIPGCDHKLLNEKDMPILYDFLIKLLEVNIKH